ncbi:AarF/ABC1/UbiB kinase family protein, partial [Candidatus Woesearchaeota archaeon]|nr:AarF/ABC1/UbiB kinase family protein [Candidatus Woesearchaeota archaeon]
QRPNIEETIELDFDLLVYITKFIKNRSKVLKSMNITEMVKEARVAIMKELEFTKEISNIEKLYDNLRDDSNVKIPKPYRDLTTSKVLVMEFIDGIKITDMERINELGLDKKKIISNLIKSIYRQILRDGFFHGDPHPANVFVLKDGRIAFLDFGMVGYMDQQNKESYIKQSIALSSGNSLDFIKVYTQNNNFDMNSLDLETLEHEIDKLTLGWFKQEIKSNGEFYYKVLMLMFQNGVGTSNQIVVLSKCLLTLSSLVRIYEVSNEESIQIFLEALGEEKVARDTIMKQGLTKYLTDFYNNGMELFVSSLGALRDFVGRREQ